MILNSFILLLFLSLMENRVEAAVAPRLSTVIRGVSSWLRPIVKQPYKTSALRLPIKATYVRPIKAISTKPYNFINGVPVMQSWSDLDNLAAATLKEARRITKNKKAKERIQKLKLENPEKYEAYLEKERVRNRANRDSLKNNADKKEDYAQKRREAKERYYESLKDDPAKKEAHLQKKREAKERFKQSLKDDPAKKEAYLRKQRESNERYKESLKKNPAEWEAYLQKQREGDTKYKDSLKIDPAKRAEVNRKRREAYKAQKEKEKQQKLETNES